MKTHFKAIWNKSENQNTLPPLQLSKEVPTCLCVGWGKGLLSVKNESGMDSLVTSANRKQTKELTDCGVFLQCLSQKPKQYHALRKHNEICFTFFVFLRVGPSERSISQNLQFPSLYVFIHSKEKRFIAWVELLFERHCLRWTTKRSTCWVPASYIFITILQFIKCMGSRIARYVDVNTCASTKCE